MVTTRSRSASTGRRLVADSSERTSPQRISRSPARKALISTTNSPKSKDLKKRKADPKEPAADIGKDVHNVILLVILYLLQGIPLGLAMGSMPFILKKKLSYAQMAVFSLTAYPYSLKLFWSPVVDALFFKRIGRRKSWIIPIQFLLAVFLIVVGMWIDEWLSLEHVHVEFMTAIFMCMVLLAATQDIAVDGWALTLLSEENVGYASTCQTIGLNTGYFLSFSLFLALNSLSFCNTYLRSTPMDVPILTAGPFFQFWGAVFLVVTVWLIFKYEKPETDEMDIQSAYFDIWQVIRLPNMRTFIVILLIAKVGFVTHDAVTAFKLIEKGFKEEELGVTALINFPLQILFGYYAAKWSSGDRRLRPWLYAFFGRLAVVLVALYVVSIFPAVISREYFVTVILVSVLGSFMSTVQFVSMGAFFAHIADPAIGGTYMTLLNTLSNFGGTYPQYFVLKAVDALTEATCSPTDQSSFTDAFACNTKALKQKCKDANGTCDITQDGYYMVGILGAALGLISVFLFIRPRILQLERLPSSKWRVAVNKKIN